jgi:hypothetical protein
VSFTRARVDAAVFGGPGDQEMQAVAEIGFPDGLLGVGYAAAHEQAWLFFNGHWQPELKSPLARGTAAINSVTSFRRGAVAVGQQAVFKSELATAWTLSGQNLTAACLDGSCVAPIKPRTEVAYGVTAGPNLIVAVGRDLVNGHFDARVWTSADGSAWTPAPANPAVLGGTDDQVMKAVVATSSGFLAVGRNGLDAAVWTSADGSRWQRVTSNAFGGFRAQEMDAIAHGPSGFVAVGTDRSSGETQGAAWVSSDGTSWTRIRDPALSDRPGTALTGIAAVPGGFVAAGFRGAASEEKDAAAWSTRDGKRWRKVSSASFGGPGAQEVDTVTFSPRFGVVAVGDSQASSGDLDAAVWFGKLGG